MREAKKKKKAKEQDTRSIAGVFTRVFRRLDSGSWIKKDSRHASSGVQGALLTHFILLYK